MAPAVGMAVFLAMLGAGAHMTGLESDSQGAQRRAVLLNTGNILKARISQELGSVLYLSSGLGSYLAVRNKSLDRQEILDILSRLYAETRHVRNFGIAVGTTLSYVYPVEGNEKAIGLRYQDIPAQWPGVKAVMDGGKPLLAGPVTLVQGGRGLVYRVPVSIDRRYWGLLSTVVDADSLFASAFETDDMQPYAIALRLRDARGRDGEVIHGDAGIFEQEGTETLNIEVPGGTWVLGIAMREVPADSSLLWRLRVVTLLLSLLAGWYVYQLLRHRSRLSHLALHDALTGLPNRRLLEDRMQRALLQQRRNSGRTDKSVAILLFDLNGFKAVNDRHGHKAGDHVLHVVAERVTRAMRAADTVGRWGGDEFVVVALDVDRLRLDELVERVRAAVSVPVEYGEQILQVGASVGVAVFPGDGEDTSQLIRLADQRMYESKPGRGQNR